MIKTWLSILSVYSIVCLGSLKEPTDSEKAKCAKHLNEMQLDIARQEAAIMAARMKFSLITAYQNAGIQIDEKQIAVTIEDQEFRKPELHYGRSATPEQELATQAIAFVSAGINSETFSLATVLSIESLSSYRFITYDSLGRVESDSGLVCNLTGKRKSLPSKNPGEIIQNSKTRAFVRRVILDNKVFSEIKLP